MRATVARAYAFAHAYRREESREPAATRAGAWAPLRLQGAERLPLPAPAMGLLAGVDVAEAIGAGRPGAAAPDAPYLERLATLLYASLGVLRIDLGDPRGHAVHRPIPSPSNLYPSELFVYVPGGRGAGEGIHHYDAIRHDLAPVPGRENARGHLEAALDRSLEPFDAVLLVSSVLWRLVQKYSNFAYRLACLEAGHLVGNLLIAARALGWHGRVQYLFRDDLVEAALGLPRLSVATMAVVLLSRDGAGRPCPRPGAVAGGGAGRPPAGRWRLHPDGEVHAPRSAAVEEMEVAARGGPGPRKAPAWRSRRGSPPGCPAAAPAAARMGLLEALRRRHAGTSGPNGIAVRPAPLSGESVSRLLTTALAAYPTDLDGPAGPCPPRLVAFAIANRVEGLAPAAYRRDEGGDGLRRVTCSGMPAEALWYRDLVDGGALGAVWALAVDYEAALEDFGDRGYRMANLEAGLVGQRICLLAAGERMFARPFCAFDERVLDRWLGLAWTGLSTAYLVLHGADRMPQLGVELPWVDGRAR
jgi:SagB-type dehydrogenase family enzyme